MKHFVKFLENSPEFEALIAARPSAFGLLALIAYRARKTGLSINDGIETGEAFIGDFEKYGATEQSYLTDKKYLEKYKLATFRSTSTGTIAKIINSCVFEASEDHTPTDESTDESTALQDLKNLLQQNLRGVVI